MPPESSATVAVALAAMGESPNATSTGYATSIPPPASAFTAPAAAAQTLSIAISENDTSAQRQSFHGAAHAVAVEIEKELAVRDGHRELHPALEPLHELREQLAIDRIEFERLGAMDTLPFVRAQEEPRLLVRVHRHARRRLARLVQPRGIRRADLDPRRQRAGEVAHADGRHISLAQSLRKRNPFLVFEAVRENARREILLGLRGMARGLDGKRFVDTTVDGAECDVDRVHRGRESHRTKLATSRPLLRVSLRLLRLVRVRRPLGRRWRTLAQLRYHDVDRSLELRIVTGGQCRGCLLHLDVRWNALVLHDPPALRRHVRDVRRRDGAAVHQRREAEDAD